MPRSLTSLLAVTTIALLALPAQAQEDASDKLTIELNSVEAQDGNCRMSFVVLNGFDTDLKSAVFEAVLFDKAGAVDRMTLFDFGSLPATRTRVRQFVVPQLACDSLGRVLINGAQTCETDIEASTAQDVCGKALNLRSRIDVEVIG
ncbi:hypothetical protein J4E08_04120 [Sagittula sp. NFXS13]|uniref:hypothetical protein n=1 Tax=Sagittula sp. NFXS13 TaxID=2819095 RepID=UPI0032DE4364